MPSTRSCTISIPFEVLLGAQREVVKCSAVKNGRLIAHFSRWFGEAELKTESVCQIGAIYRELGKKGAFSDLKKVHSDV